MVGSAALVSMRSGCIGLGVCCSDVFIYAYVLVCVNDIALEAESVAGGMESKICGSMVVAW